MKSKIGFVAIGQAGGNISKKLEDKGFPVLYLNTSEEDLSTLDGAKYKYHITGGEGCNKDRIKAKQLVIDDYDNIAQEIDSKLDVELIYIVFGSGGGTGSGAAPMLADLLIDDGKTVGIITVIPSEQESIKSHMNSYEAIKELAAITGLSSCFMIDNNRGNKLELNQKFADPFCDFISIPGAHTSTKGIIDKAEVMETLKAHGMAYVFTSDPGSAEALHCLKDNVFAPLEGDQTVKYISISLAGDTDLLDIQKEIGVPLDSFVTYNDKSTVCCITGLSYPQSRLDIVYNKVQESKDVIVKNLKSTRESRLKEDINFLDSIEVPQKEKQQDHKPKSKRDIMSKYLR